MIKTTGKIGVLMITAVLLVLLCCVGTVSAVDATATNSILENTQSSSESYLSDSFFVKYPTIVNEGVQLPGMGTNAYAEILADFSSIVPGLLLVKVPDGFSVEDSIRYYEDVPGVEYAEPNYLVISSGMPNDPEYPTNQWGLYNPPAQGGISAEAAWDLSTGNDSIVVAVVDSGVEINHPDLKDHIWNNTDEIPNNGIDDDHNGYIDDCHGWNILKNTSDVRGYQVHGTHCAGIIGAVTNNSVGIAGTAWNVTIMPILIFPHEGGASSAYIVAGIKYAIDNNADIISLSLGSQEATKSLKEVIEVAEKKGILCVCAAGNEGVDNEKTPQYPASFDCSNIIAVAASDSNNMLADFSNWGNTSVDIAAPGVDIYSTIPNVSTSISTVVDYSDAQINVTGSSWMRGYQLGYINGSTTSLLYSTLPILPSVSNLIGVKYWVTYNFSKAGNGSLQFLITNRSFATYANITDFQKNYTGIHVIGTIKNDFQGPDYTSYSYGFSKEDIKLGDGPYYFGLYYTSDVPTDEFNILAWTITYDYEFEGYTYGYKNGTSMATPMVAGAAAVIKSINPSLTPEEIRQIIIDTADQIPALYGKTVSNGRMNLSAAALMARIPVTFNSTGGSDVPSQAVCYNKTIAEPVAPVRAGYTFAEWDKDSGLTAKWDFANDRVFGSTTLYANWTVNETNVLPTNTTATFGNDNVTAVNPKQTSVSKIVLDSVMMVNDSNMVTFTAANNTLHLPELSGYTKNDEVSIFEITATPLTGATSLIVLNVTFSSAANATAAKDKVRFLHNNGPGDWTLLTSHYTYTAGDANVTYTVETKSFSPFGIGLYTAKPVSTSVSSSSSRHSGSTVILREDQVVSTPYPTVVPTIEPADNPAVSTIIPTVTPTTQPTQKSPASVLGILAGLGTAAIFLGRLRK